MLLLPLFLSSDINSCYAQKIVAAEYFFNQDPGFGNAHQIVFNPQDSTVNVNFNTSISILPYGFNQLNIRTKDSAGVWSLTNTKYFIKKAQSVQSVVKAEYFIDIDPGFDHAQSISLTPGLDISNVLISANIAGLSNGMHQLFVRTANDKGVWSLTNATSFLKISKPVALTNAEYFFDTDPGFGNAIPVVLNNSINIQDLNIPINISQLTAGIHRLYFRSKDSIKKDWSLTNYFDLNVTSSNQSAAIVINSVSGYRFCVGDNFKIAFHETGSYLAGNRFNVELSDSAGSFNSPIIIGSIQDTVSRVVQCSIPFPISNGINYKIRVVSTAPVVVGLSTAIPIIITNVPDLGNDTVLYIRCNEELVNLTGLFNLTGYNVIWNLPNPSQATAGNYTLIAQNGNACKDSVHIFVKQEIAVWTGTVTSDWHNPLNWDIQKVPSDYTHVFIKDVSNNPCVVSFDNAHAASVTLKNANMLSVINDKNLIITGNCDSIPIVP